MNAELIKALRHCTSDGDFDHCEHCKIRVCSEEGMIKILDALEAADKAQRWISVEERLPEHNQDVLAITKAGNLSVGQNIVTCTFCKPRNEKHGLFYLPYTMGRNLIVTHWQPLPQPPQKGE